MRRAVLASVFILVIVFFPQNVFVKAWSNGGYSADTTNPDYGTHDWIAQRAVDWLPAEKKQYITDNLANYLYGTELPDLPKTQGGIGDTTKHHIYYTSTGALADDAAAVRAEAEYQLALNYLEAGNYPDAAKHAGAMSHYIADMAVFSHVMGASTEWGTETHHSDYETHANSVTITYSSTYLKPLQYDGSLTTLTAGDAARQLALDTTLDAGDTYTAKWMDQNYDWASTTFTNRSWESVNLAANKIADTLSTLYDAQATTTQTGAVKITIIDDANTPQAGATVTSTTTPTGQTQLQGTTLTDGTVTFSNINAGAYTFEASKTDHKKNTDTTTIAAGQTATLTIKIEKNGIPGFPVEAIALGIILFLGYSIFYRMKRKK
jgi:hypothetical protein